jgi:hypothetical protein
MPTVSTPISSRTRTNRTMKLLNVSTLAGLSLVVACAPKGGAGTQDPDAGTYDDYYSETGGGGATGNTGDGSGHRPVARAGTSTRHIDRPVGRKLVAKKPPVDGDDKPRTPHDSPGAEALVLDGFMPTTAGPGSVLEIYGAGLDQRGLGVLVGGKRAKVVDAAADRVLVEVPTGGKPGPIALTFGGANLPPGVKHKSRAGTAQVRSQTSFAPLAADAGFGKPRTNPAHGLVGHVYDLGGEVTEIPSFNDLGDPVAVVAVDNLSIPSYEFNGALGGLNEWFGIHFRGSLNITESGEYELCVASGDGAQLYLDEQLIVNNDGVHATKESCEPVFAEPGEYQIDVLYFQGQAGELGLTLSWAKDGGAKEPIPALHLFPPEGASHMAMP